MNSNILSMEVRFSGQQCCLIGLGNQGAGVTMPAVCGGRWPRPRQSPCPCPCPCACLHPHPTCLYLSSRCAHALGRTMDELPSAACSNSSGRKHCISCQHKKQQLAQVQRLARGGGDRDGVRHALAWRSHHTGEACPLPGQIPSAVHSGWVCR
jgi:hypothetical protein